MEQTEKDELTIQTVLAYFIAQPKFNRSIYWYRQVHSIIAKEKHVECGLCLRKIEKIGQVTIDHIVPRSKGGDNSLSNKQLAHGGCNNLKGSNSFLPPTFYRQHTTESGNIIISKGIKDKLKEWDEANKAAAIERKRKHIENFTVNKGVKKEKPKKVKPKFELKPETNNWATDLWNEIARNQFKNLSYTKFEQYFKNYSQQQA